MYSYILYFGYDCFKLMGVVVLLLLLAFVFVLRKYFVLK